MKTMLLFLSLLLILFFASCKKDAAPTPITIIERDTVYIHDTVTVVDPPLNPEVVEALKSGVWFMYKKNENGLVSIGQHVECTETTWTQKYNSPCPSCVYTPFTKHFLSYNTRLKLIAGNGVTINYEIEVYQVTGLKLTNLANASILYLLRN